MLFLTLEDLHGTLDAILFSDAYRAAKSMVGRWPACLGRIEFRVWIWHG